MRDKFRKKEVTKMSKIRRVRILSILFFRLAIMASFSGGPLSILDEQRIWKKKSQRGNLNPKEKQGFLMVEESLGDISGCPHFHQAGAKTTIGWESNIKRIAHNDLTLFVENLIFQ